MICTRLSCVSVFLRFAVLLQIGSVGLGSNLPSFFLLASNASVISIALGRLLRLRFVAGSERVADVSVEECESRFA